MFAEISADPYELLLHGLKNLLTTWATRSVVVNLAGLLTPRNRASLDPSHSDDKKPDHTALNRFIRRYATAGSLSSLFPALKGRAKVRRRYASQNQKPSDLKARLILPVF
jgi:hypothetical protein